MKKATLSLFFLLSFMSCVVYSFASVLILSPDGACATKPSLESAMVDADASGKTVVVTSPQIVSTRLAWPENKELKFSKGGYLTFSGTGSLSGLKESTPEMFGSNTNPGTTDMTVAIKAAYDTAINSNCPLILTGPYLVSSTISPHYVDRALSAANRYHSIPVIGKGQQITIINYTGTGYAIDYRTNLSPDKYLDTVTIKGGLQIHTSTGGGIALPAGGGIVIEDFFMNGCAAGRWGLYLDGSHAGGVGIYNIKIGTGRFWHNNEDYKGGAIYANNFLSMDIQNVFISQQQVDGPVCQFTNYRNLNIENTQIEGTNPATTKQIGILLGGGAAGDTGFQTVLNNLYFEGRIDTAIALGTQTMFGIKVQNIFCNFYSGKSSPVVFDAGSTNTHKGIEVDGITYYSSDTGTGGGYIINDPSKLVNNPSANNFNASSPGSQQIRRWTQPTGFLINSKSDIIPSATR